jgi:type VI secretion system protein ImpL
MAPATADLDRELVPAPMTVAAAAAAGGAGDDTVSGETRRLHETTSVALLPEDVQPHNPRPVFLNHLFERKIFPESRLARPLSVVDTSRNRVILTAKILTAVFALVAGIGTLSAYVRFANLKRDHLGPLFSQLADDLGHSDFKKAERGSETAEERNARAQHVTRDTNSVLQSMSRLSASRLRSVFIPASWDGTTDHDLQEGLAKAFSTIVLNGFRIDLSLQLKNLIQKTTPRLARTSTTADDASDPDAGMVRTRLVEPIYEAPESVPEYHAWEQFLAGLRELETNIARYNRIATPGGGTASDLTGLLKYLKLDSDLPPDFDFNNPYFIAMLSQSSNQQFAYQNDDASVIDRDEAVAHAQQLVRGFFKTWFGPQNHLMTSIDEMAASINKFPDNGNDIHYESLKETADEIGHVISDLQSPAFEWLSDGEFDIERFPAFTQPTDLEYLQGFRIGDDVGQYGYEGYRKFIRALAQKSTRLTGQVLDLDNAPVQVTSSVATLQANLRVLLEQPFVAREPGPAKALDAGLPMWDRGTLLEADRLFDAYDKYERGSLRTAPPYVRTALRRVALGRLEQNVLDYVGQAQGAAPTGSPEGAEAQSFSQSLDVLQRLLNNSAKFPAQTTQRSFNNVVAVQASNLLVVLDRQLKDKNLYAVRDQNFDWWQGEKPLSLAAYDVRGADDLKDYVDHQREQVTNLAQQAEPLVRFLQARGGVAGRDVASAMNDWRLIGQELKKYTEKAPANSVSLLEDLIRTGLDKVAPDSSCQDPGRDPAGRSDFFLTARSQLRSGALARCRLLSYTAYTTQIAEFFNQKLAGRFPFAAAPPADVLSEADPKALAAFYARLDQFGKIALDSLTQSTQFGSSRDAALAFLSRMQQLRPVFATFLAGFEKEPAPSFDFIVNFRVNRGREVQGNQIGDWSLDVGAQSLKYRAKENTGRWRMGDPIRIAFRFADDSPLIPYVDNAQPGMNVHQRTVSYDYPGAWSLFRLLLAHKPEAAEFEKGADTSPHTLGFLMPGTPDRTLPHPKDETAGGLVRVYVQLAVVPPGGKDGVIVPLPFPTLAPALSEK